jgi:hypothetical protein
VGLEAVAPPAGGVLVWVVDVPLAAGCDGMVKPCCSRHFWNAVRSVVLLPWAEAAAEEDVVVLLVVVLLPVLPPQAAIATLVASTATPSIARCARRGLGLGRFISGVLSWGV